MADPLTLASLERAVRDSWSLDTADENDDWTPEHPSRGQCDITSLVVHEYLGGDLLGADVLLDGERIMAHMWNRLPSGIEIDLTRDQFTQGEIVCEPVVRQLPAESDPTHPRHPSHPRHHRYLKYLVLSERVRSRLRSSQVSDLKSDTGGSRLAN